MKFIIIICVYVLRLSSCEVLNDGTTLRISLNGSLPTLQDSEIYHSRYNLSASSTVTVVLTEIPPSLGFLILQTHSYRDNLTLSYKQRPLDIRYHVNGTNLGLIVKITDKNPLYIMNFLRNSTVDFYLSIHAYYKQAPLPGGCNMEFNIEDAPFMKIQYDKSVIQVDANQARDTIDGDCDVASLSVTHTFYKMYISEWDHSADGYFDGLKKMITIGNILQHGEHVPRFTSFAELRKTFSLYPGTGSFYAIIANNSNMSSAYVPIHTYGYDGHGISGIDLFLVIIMTIFGIIINFFGFLLFSYQFYIFGLLFILMFIYTLINFINESFLNIAVFYAVGCCVLFTFHKFAVKTGFPFPAMFALGFQISCMLYYSTLAGIFEYDALFWLIFSSTVLLITLVAFTPMSYNIACSIVGSFCLTLLIDFLVGSYLRYIVINLLRRLTVRDFNLAIIDPPYQWRDLTVTICWIILTASGLVIHRIFGKNYYLFSPFIAMGTTDDATTPLLHSRNNESSSDFGTFEDSNEDSEFQNTFERYYPRLPVKSNGVNIPHSKLYH